MKTPTFEYGYAQLKDLTVCSTASPSGKKELEVLLKGEPLKPSQRFWTTLHVRFGFSDNIFHYFSHEEVFRRISAVAPNNRFRWCIERDGKGAGRLLAVTNPTAPVIKHNNLMSLLRRYEAAEVTYHNGVVRSAHAPRFSGTFRIAGDEFQNKFVLDTPIDGYGRPSIYLSLLRLVCSNGAIAHTPAFRSEVVLGKGENGTEYSLVRALDGFNNEEGYSALRQRFEASAKSWVSVNEVNRLYKTLVRLHHHRGLVAGVKAQGTDGAREPILSGFHKMTGDLTRLYGLANLDGLSVKRQRTLPAACTVYDLLNFTTEVATHHAGEEAGRSLQAYVGDLISSEYDLEGTVDQFGDWRDFFIANDATTATMAKLRR